MDELTTTQGIVAVAAAGVGLLALVLAIVVAFKLRRMRAAQRAVLGESGARDLVSHAERLEAGFVELRDWVEETAAGLEQRVDAAEGRVDGCIAYRSMVRYDAYGEMSGEQSSSVALLDARRSGVVVSSISHRDQARVYVKQVVKGESEIQLSPEEQEAIEKALGGATEASARA
ncbi:MAG: DUF4446 family protein [Actinomycetota bacterium]|nr:DUF4446 family protein [Actinomycetota bacterium]MDQ3719688.1 DUF4446 family protein [Actinomycetota bacterium]